jgi:hypothetical protein
MEEFEYIKGYENLYKINKAGKIFSCIYQKEMIQMMTADGYLYVHLSKEGKRYKGYIHRLLGKQYLENLDNKPEIDHIDRNKINNNLINLRWVTRLENARNKSNYKDNLTPEQLEARKARTRERAKLWARKNRELKKNILIEE